MYCSKKWSGGEGGLIFLAENFGPRTISRLVQLHTKAIKNVESRNKLEMLKLDMLHENEGRTKADQQKWSGGLIFSAKIWS